MKRKEQIKKYRNSDLPALFKAEKDLGTKIFDLKMKLPLGKVKNTTELKNLKRELARVKTFIRQRVSADLENKK